MNELNKLRLLAGIPIDSASERRSIKEAKLAQASVGNLKKRAEAVNLAIKHIRKAIESLKSAPKMDHATDVEDRYIKPLLDMLSSDGGEVGLEHYAATCQKEYGSAERIADAQKQYNSQARKADRAREKAEQEEQALAAAADNASQVEQEENADSDELTPDDIKYIEDTYGNDRGRKELGYPEKSERYTPSAKDYFVPGDDDDQRAHTSSYPEQEEASQKPKESYFSIQWYDKDNKVVGGHAVKTADMAAAHKIANSANEKHSMKVHNAVRYTIVPDKAMNKAHGIGESVHYYNDNYDNYDATKTEPVNVLIPDNTKEVDGVVFKVADLSKLKGENPNQLDKPGSPSDADMTENKVKVPASVKSALKNAMDEVEKGAKKLGDQDNESKTFYNTLYNAMKELLGYIEGGTVHDIKKAQIFWSSLMGPILHKIPEEVAAFIVNGGERRTLKDFLVKVKSEQ